MAMPFKEFIKNLAKKAKRPKGSRPKKYPDRMTSRLRANVFGRKRKDLYVSGTKVGEFSYSESKEAMDVQAVFDHYIREFTNENFISEMMGRIEGLKLDKLNVYTVDFLEIYPEFKKGNPKEVYRAMLQMVASMKPKLPAIVTFDVIPQYDYINRDALARLYRRLGFIVVESDEGNLNGFQIFI